MQKKYLNQSRDKAFKERNKVIQEGEIVRFAQESALQDDKKWGQMVRDGAREVNSYWGTSFVEQDLGRFRAWA